MKVRSVLVAGGREEDVDPCLTSANLNLVDLRPKFLGVVESWTSIWTDVVRPYVTLRTYPLSVSGATGFVGDVAGKVRAKLGKSPS